MMNETPSVRLSAEAKTLLVSRNAEKQRRYRLAQQQRAGLTLHKNCRECGAPIKPSCKRGFCANDEKCRKAFFKKVQVAHLIPLDRQSKELSSIFAEPPADPFPELVMNLVALAAEVLRRRA